MLTLRADVREAADAQRLVDETVRRFGGVDVLVNNAGVGKFANVADMTLDEWRQVIDTNLSGVFYCTRAAIPAMKARGAGFIVNISSLAGKNSFTTGAAYCASKAGLNAFSEALDAGSPARQHPRQLRDAGIGRRPPSGISPAKASDRLRPGDDWKLTRGRCRASGRRLDRPRSAQPAEPGRAAAVAAA